MVMRQERSRPEIVSESKGLQFSEAGENGEIVAVEFYQRLRGIFETFCTLLDRRRVVFILLQASQARNIDGGGTEEARNAWTYSARRDSGNLSKNRSGDGSKGDDVVAELHFETIAYVY